MTGGARKDWFMVSSWSAARRLERAGLGRAEMAGTPHGSWPCLATDRGEVVRVVHDFEAAHGPGDPHLATYLLRRFDPARGLRRRNGKSG